MKWPKQLVLIRHAQSAYNELRQRKERSNRYQNFVQAFEDKPDFPREFRKQEGLREQASAIQEQFALRCSDRDTELTGEGIKQALRTGEQLEKLSRAGSILPPNVVMVSPYKRTRDTLRIMQDVWPALAHATVYEDERIREKDHGLSLLYNDWRVFHTFHPDQAALYNLLGGYDYRFPNGENIPDVRDRIRDWNGTLVREFAGQSVFAFTHHLTILSMRANLERLGVEQFQHLDEKEKPVNCGVTIYRGEPGQGKNGKLLLQKYNDQLY